MKSWLKCTRHEPNRKFCREKGEIRPWILLIKVLASWPFGPFWKLQCGMHHNWCWSFLGLFWQQCGEKFLFVLCLPSGASLWQEEMEHSLKYLRVFLGSSFFGGWDRAWSERSLWQEWRLRRAKPAVSGNVQAGKERLISGMHRDLWN